MDIRFDGKCAIVTGAASGIGLAIARQLAASGARVVLADLDSSKTEAAAQDIGHGARAFVVDVTKADQVAALVAFAQAECGALHLMVNNAGIGGPIAPLGAYDIADWLKVIDVNLNGVFYGMRYAIPAIKAAGGGTIVNIASILGQVGFAGAAAYTATKHAIVGLTKAAALDHATDGIRINAVAPGFIHTPMVDQGLDAAAQAGIAAKHALARMGEPAEVAALVCFLLSERASFMTGSCHLVDGGYCAQ
ncbi:SDR family oxidoreductase [Rhodobacterales bacterium LSUCC0031]|nr:SDR family oxidoreductase [Rhodobacterales bacterium LSUCC0031]